MPSTLTFWATLVGGGAGGAIIAAALTEWIRGRRGRLQRVQLIERVNRLVEPTEGFALARLVEERPKGKKQWVPVEGVREYQFTLRNTTSVHLKDLEIQFEFPVAQVEGLATRPVLSRTALEVVAPAVSEPWKSGHRWKIPYLPPKDSVEFTFKSVNCPSEEYEAALLNADRVVIQKMHGEPAQGEVTGQAATSVVLVLLLMLSLGFCGYLLLRNERSALAPKDEMAAQAEEDKASQAPVGEEAKALKDEGFGQVGARIGGAGCEFTVESSYNATLKDTEGGPKKPWQIFDYITNTGKQKCVYQLPGREIRTLKPSNGQQYFGYSDAKPKLTEIQIRFGLKSPTTKATAKFYLGN